MYHPLVPLVPPRITLSCLHMSLSRASTYHSLVPPRVTLSCLHVSLSCLHVSLPGKFFYVYDLETSTLSRGIGIAGRAERSLERFVISPDNEW